MINFPHQSTEWDCLPKAFESALLAIFGQQRVPQSAMRAVYRHSIDCDDGTSKSAINKVSNALAKVPGILVRRLRGKAASPLGVRSALCGSCAIVLPTWVECDDGWLYPHAVAAVGVVGRCVRIADPYSSCRTVTLRSLGSGSGAID